MGSTGGTARDGQVKFNKIQNVPYWAGILTYDDYYAAIENNCIEDAWRGVQVDNYFYQSQWDLAQRLKIIR